MTNERKAGGTVATCHCGAVTVSLATQPTEVTDCNCSLCRSYGVLWVYLQLAHVTVAGPAPENI